MKDIILKNMIKKEFFIKNIASVTKLLQNSKTGPKSTVLPSTEPYSFHPDVQTNLLHTEFYTQMPRKKSETSKNKTTTTERTTTETTEATETMRLENDWFNVVCLKPTRTTTTTTTTTKTIGTSSDSIQIGFQSSFLYALLLMILK